MGKQYSAQNVAAYLIYEFNERNLFINADLLQQLLLDVEAEWVSLFGHSAYTEKVVSIEENGYAVKEVYDKYVQLKDEHIELPASEWYLKFGEFQLVQRTYGIPPYTAFEEQVVQNIIAAYSIKQLRKAS